MPLSFDVEQGCPCLCLVPWRGTGLGELSVWTLWNALKPGGNEQSDRFLGLPSILASRLLALKKKYFSGYARGRGGGVSCVLFFA